MISQILTPKIVILMVGLIVLLLWLLPPDQPIISAPDTSTEGTVLLLSTAPVPNVNNNVQMAEGVHLNSEKTLVSVNFSSTPRLLIVQQVADAAGFDFTLPDQAINYWSEPLSVHLNNEPLTTVLSAIIGAKNFTLEMSYNSASTKHKISALLLSSIVERPTTILSPLGKNEPLPLERDFADAPNEKFSENSEQRIKRNNFFSADEQTRVAILQEMSPVGEDLHYIVASLRQDKSVSVRIAAAQRLSFSENYLATQTLLDALSDSDHAVVEAVADSLVSLGDASVIPAMENKLGSSEKTKMILQDASLRIQSRFSIAADRIH